MSLEKTVEKKKNVLRVSKALISIEKKNEESGIL